MPKAMPKGPKIGGCRAESQVEYTIKALGTRISEVISWKCFFVLLNIHTSHPTVRKMESLLSFADGGILRILTVTEVSRVACAAIASWELKVPSEHVFD